MHDSYKKWLDDGQPKVFCKCGCGEEIIIKEYCSWKECQERGLLSYFGDK